MKKTIIPLLLLLLVISSCTTARKAGGSKPSREHVSRGKQKSARPARQPQSSTEKMLAKNKNKVLLFMEQGKTAYDQGRFAASNALFEEAYKTIDDGIRTKAGQAIAANLTNPMAAPYKPEDFEKVMIHYYKAINYFQLNEMAEALVEAKRINIKLQEMNEKYDSKKNLYKEDAFAHILQGIIYEAQDDWNNAFIAYQNATELFYKNGKGVYFNVLAPLQLQKDMLRMCIKMGFNDELSKYETRFGIKYDSAWESPQSAVVFWENGSGPRKSEIKLMASNGFFSTSYGPGYDISIPIPTSGFDITSIAIPRYNPASPAYRSATISSQGKDYSLESVEDFETIAKQCLTDRMNREVGKIILRVAAKKSVKAGMGALATHFLGSTAGQLTKAAVDIAGAIVEHADTRNWKSLPAMIHYTRVPLEQGENTLAVAKKTFDNNIINNNISLNASNRLNIISIVDL